MKNGRTVLDQAHPGTEKCVSDAQKNSLNVLGFLIYLLFANDPYNIPSKTVNACIHTQVYSVYYAIRTNIIVWL